jgi:hypothetical protein
MFNGVKVFSATLYADRQVLGERVTEWIRSTPNLEIVDMLVTQSSDDAYHMIAITIFFNTPLAARKVTR